MDFPPTPWWPDLDRDLTTKTYTAPLATAHQHLYYTDGSATTQPRPRSGWGFLYFEDAHLRAEVGGAVLTNPIHQDWCGARLHTNNTAEISAMIQVFKHALTTHPTEDLELRYDSTLAAGLAQGTLEPTSNLELAASLRYLVTRFEEHATATFTHVRAHQGEWWNERVDSLAKRGSIFCA